MGIGIMIPGAHFTDERYIIGKVKIPVPECEHVYDNDCDAVCNLCGTVRPVPHNLVHVEAVEATDTENGNVEYWHCTLCGGYWLDEACTQPTTAEDVVVLSIGSYPVKATLMGLYNLGGTLDGSLINHAPEPHINTAAVELQGDVVVSEDYCTFDGMTNQNRMTTYLRIPSAYSAILLFRVPTGERVLVGNRSGSTGTTGFGVSLYNSKALFGTNDAITQREFTAINSNNFAILAITAYGHDTNGTVRVARYTNGALSTLVNFTGDVEPWLGGSTGNAICIGGFNRSNDEDAADISLAAIHEGVLDDEQLAEICAFVKAYGEQKFKGTDLTIE